MRHRIVIGLSIFAGLAILAGALFIRPAEKTEPVLEEPDFKVIIQEESRYEDLPGAIKAGALVVLNASQQDSLKNLSYGNIEIASNLPLLNKNLILFAQASINEFGAATDIILLRTVFENKKKNLLIYKKNKVDSDMQAFLSTFTSLLGEDSQYSWRVLIN